MGYNAKIRADAMKLNPIDEALFIKMAEKLDFCQEKVPPGIWKDCAYRSAKSR